MLLACLPCGGVPSILAGPLLSLGFSPNFFLVPFLSVWEASRPGLHTPLALRGASLPTTPLSGLRLPPGFLFLSGPSLQILLFFIIPSLISSAFFPGLDLDSFLPCFLLLLLLFPLPFLPLFSQLSLCQPPCCRPALQSSLPIHALFFVLATSEGHYEALHSLEGSCTVRDTGVADN